VPRVRDAFDQMIPNFELNYSLSMLPRLAPGDPRKLEQEKQEFRAKLQTAINDEDDPLAVYDQFIQWTLKIYGENDPNSGLTELLEQATREFKEDTLYKTDLRYLRLWSLYARRLERSGAIAIYAYLVSSEIGTSYSVLYEEYAALLEEDGRCVEHVSRLYNN
jgi:checkpoint serine/threonine-protein kinase